MLCNLPSVLDQHTLDRCELLGREPVPLCVLVDTGTKPSIPTIEPTPVVVLGGLVDQLVRCLVADDDTQTTNHCFTMPGIVVISRLDEKPNTINARLGSKHTQTLVIPDTIIRYNTGYSISGIPNRLLGPDPPTINLTLDLASDTAPLRQPHERSGSIRND